MRKLALLLLLLLAGTTVTQPASLYDQSIAEVLRKRFHIPDVSYLAMDAPMRTLVAWRWESLVRTVPTGSMVKPFTALAYGQSHGYQYPKLTCRGVDDGCWLPRGHGRIGVSEAIGYSCNAYFRVLAAAVSPDEIEQVTLRYGIHSPFASLSSHALVGLGGGLEVAPERILQAYVELSEHMDEPAVAVLLQGMALSAQAGTASAIQKSLPGARALAKTGTAPCVHDPRAPGDGYTIILYPADSPRVALLVQVHGAPGARAALVGGELLRTIVTGK